MYINLSAIVNQHNHDLNNSFNHLFNFNNIKSKTNDFKYAARTFICSIKTSIFTVQATRKHKFRLLVEKIAVLYEDTCEMKSRGVQSNQSGQQGRELEEEEGRLGLGLEITHPYRDPWIGQFCFISGFIFKIQQIFKCQLTKFSLVCRDVVLDDN